jgi:hypothetical protein
MSHKKNDVVTAVTMLGEVVGKYLEEDDTSFTLGDPRLFVPGQDGKGGFAPGLSMTGSQELNEAKINKAVCLSVIPSHPEIEAGWREITSGIIV